MSDATNRRGPTLPPFAPSGHYDGSDSEHSPSSGRRSTSYRTGSKRRAPADTPSDNDDNENTPTGPAPGKRLRAPAPAPEESVTEPESDGPGREPTGKQAYIKMLTKKGRMVIRYVSFSAYWPTILSIGLKRDPDDDSSKYTTLQNEQYEIFQRLEYLIPDLRDAMLEAGPDSPVDFGKALQTGGRGAHATDISTVKSAMIRLLNGHGYNPMMKQEMGFRNKRCAKLNCPADLNFEADLDYEGQPGLLEKLRSGVIVPKPSDFPYGLFHKEEADLTNPSAGFLKNELALKTYITLFLSPSSALGESGGSKGTVKGNAAQHEITECNLESIIYAHHILIYKAHGGQGQFNYVLFCKTIKDTVMAFPESNRESLLQWWNEHVFPETFVQAIPKRPDGALSLAERMMAMAEVARKEAEAADRLREQEARARVQEIREERERQLAREAEGQRERRG
ncbi:hypothetical protein FB451DRAFT_1394546 [Mycena latifolia]|nr:hypothetical protein FB451DRAFT_1394546 [Mycena latifolia]